MTFINKNIKMIINKRNNNLNKVENDINENNTKIKACSILNYLGYIFIILFLIFCSVFF